MQKMTVDLNGEFLSPIDLISHDRAPQKRTLQTDLMCATRKWMKLKQGMVPKTLDGFVLGDRFSPPALGDYGHPLAMAWVTPNV